MTESGTTLIEVLAATAILSALVFGSMSLSQFIVTRSTRNSQVQDLETLGKEITQNLTYERSCLSTIGTASGMNNVISGAALNSIQQSSSSGGGWPVKVHIAGLRAGASMTDDFIDGGSDTTIASKRLTINELKLTDGYSYTPAGGNTRYVASVYLRASALNGQSLKPKVLGSLVIETDSSGSIIQCSASSSASVRDACTQMGCNYNETINPTKPCQCTLPKFVCQKPGWYPYRIVSGHVDCMPLGGDCRTADPTSFLSGVALGKPICTRAPAAVAPLPASSTWTCTYTVPGAVNFPDYNCSNIPSTLTTGMACAGPQICGTILNPSDVGPGSWAMGGNLGSAYTCGCAIPPKPTGALINATHNSCLLTSCCSSGPFPSPVFGSGGAGLLTPQAEDCQSGWEYCSAVGQATCAAAPAAIANGGTVAKPFCILGQTDLLVECQSGVGTCTTAGVSYTCVAPLASGANNNGTAVQCSGSATEPVPSIAASADTRCTSGLSNCTAMNQRTCL